MKYYQRLRDLSEDRDLSQAELVKCINTTQSYYDQYENGHRAMPFDRVILIAGFYNVSIDYIAGLSMFPERWTENRTLFPKEMIFIINNKDRYVQKI